MPLRLEDVLSAQQYRLLLDEDCIDNGNWIPAVDGKVIPGVTVVTDDPPEIGLAKLKTDARTGPVARLSYYPDADYMVRLMVPTTQQSVLSVILGRGASILDSVAANTNNTVGDPAKTPTSVDDALFGIAKLSGTVGDFEIEIDRLPHADFPALQGFIGTTTPGVVYDHCISAYNPATNTCLPIGAPLGIGGTITWIDSYIGNIICANMSLPGGYVFQYDPATSGTVTLGGATVAIEATLVDPTLQDGDYCLLYGVAYTYSQLPRTTDWQVKQPLTKPTRCVIDLYRSLSDVIEFRRWIRRRHYYCEQYNLPAASTDGSKNDPNLQEYSFVVRPHTPRLGGSGPYYDTQVLVEST
jgi:hypothetical protein